MHVECVSELECAVMAQGFMADSGQPCILVKPPAAAAGLIARRGLGNTRGCDLC